MPFGVRDLAEFHTLNLFPTNKVDNFLLHAPEIIIANQDVAFPSNLSGFSKSVFKDAIVINSATRFADIVTITRKWFKTGSFSSGMNPFLDDPIVVRLVVRPEKIYAHLERRFVD